MCYLVNEISDMIINVGWPSYVFEEKKGKKSKLELCNRKYE